MTCLRSRSALVAPASLVALVVAGCASPPSRLYLLSSVPPAASRAALQPDANAAGYGSSLPPGSTQRLADRAIGVSVTVPEYLDRTDIVERTGANELKPVYSAQWGESLAVTAARAVTDDLAARLPSDDVVMFPSRSRRNFDYAIYLDLTRFESDPQGVSTLAGRWSIADSDGVERASGRVLRAEQASGAGYGAMAAAMSRNLAAVSAEIASAVERLPSTTGSNAAAPGASAAAERTR